MPERPRPAPSFGDGAAARTMAAIARQRGRGAKPAPPREGRAARPRRHQSGAPSVGLRRVCLRERTSSSFLFSFFYFYYFFSFLLLFSPFFPPLLRSVFFPLFSSEDRILWRHKVWRGRVASCILSALFCVCVCAYVSVCFALVDTCIHLHACKDGHACVWVRDHGRVAGNRRRRVGMACPHGLRRRRHTSAECHPAAETCQRRRVRGLHFLSSSDLCACLCLTDSLLRACACLVHSFACLCLFCFVLCLFVVASCSLGNESVCAIGGEGATSFLLRI